jgi:hypothetical protein
MTLLWAASGVQVYHLFFDFSEISKGHPETSLANTVDGFTTQHSLGLKNKMVSSFYASLSTCLF